MDKRILQKLEERNQRIIEAVIRKAERECPGALAMIGVYGSFCTGDCHEKSDLDLLILINDDRGWILSNGFVLDGVGFDLYCTTWESLEADTAYTSPHIAKLMDSKIVYCPHDEDRARLEALREKLLATLDAPFDEEDLQRAETEHGEAERAYARLMRGETLSACLGKAAELLYHAENALCLLNKRYFRLGVKRVFEEFSQMRWVPENFEALANRLVRAHSNADLQAAAGDLLRAVDDCFSCACQAVRQEKHMPTADDLRGSLEEMISNWRGKIYEAAKCGDAHAALMALCSLQSFFDYLESEFEMKHCDAVTCFDPDDLQKTAEAFDRVLGQYAEAYNQAGLSLHVVESIEQFEAEYCM